MDTHCSLEQCFIFFPTKNEFHHLYMVFKMKQKKAVNDYAIFKWYVGKKTNQMIKMAKDETVISSDTLK